MGTPQYRPGGQSPIKPRRPVRRARRVAKHSTSHTKVGTDMENQPARRPQSMTLSRYGRVVRWEHAACQTAAGSLLRHRRGFSKRDRAMSRLCFNAIFGTNLATAGGPPPLRPKSGEHRDSRRIRDRPRRTSSRRARARVTGLHDAETGAGLTATAPPATRDEGASCIMRAERQWSQAELAQRVDVSRQTVNAIETGKYDPSLPLAFKLARLFGIPIEDVFDPEDGAESRSAARESR